ncbi:MAG: cytochrome b/b6 domain-containing protein [Pseudomonadota bacterium]
MPHARELPIWDLPVRLFHWLLAVAVVGAVLTAQIGGNLMVWHGRLGSLILGLIVFRLVWGVLGSRTARFTAFVRGPSAILAYLRGQWTGLGHNPLGALSVLALLGSIGFQAVSGHFADDDIAFKGPLAPLLDTHGRELATRLHHLASNGLYALVVLHLLAIGFYARVKRQNLIRPMLTGRGPVPEGQSGNSGGSVAGFFVALCFALAAVWGGQGGWIEVPPPAPPEAAPMHDW